MVKDIRPGDQKKKYSVSVVIHAYNEKRYIAECLSTITRQELNSTVENIEIIVVDNGSIDRTVEIARQFPVKIIDSSAEYVGGVRNEGVKVSTGDILVFLVSDCMVDEKWVSRCVAYLINAKVSAVGGYYNLRENPSFYEKYWIVRQVYLNPKNTLHFLTQRMQRSKGR